MYPVNCMGRWGMLNRREVIGFAAAAVVTGTWSRALGDASGEFSRSRYDHAMVVDALGGVGK